MPLRDITLDDIESLAVGAWVLGTGGGGSPYLGLLNMRALYKEGHKVQLMPASELADDDWVAAVSNMGAPLVGQERLALEQRPVQHVVGHRLYVEAEHARSAQEDDVAAPGHQQHRGEQRQVDRHDEELSPVRRVPESHGAACIHHPALALPAPQPWVSPA